VITRMCDLFVRKFSRHDHRTDDGRTRTDWRQQPSHIWLLKRARNTCSLSWVLLTVSLILTGEQDLNNKLHYGISSNDSAPIHVATISASASVQQNLESRYSVNE